MTVLTAIILFIMGVSQFAIHTLTALTGALKMLFLILWVLKSTTSLIPWGVLAFSVEDYLLGLITLITVLLQKIQKDFGMVLVQF